MRALALAAAVTAAALIPGERLGLAVPVVAALMLAALGIARQGSALRLALVTAALALAAQAAVLDAGWVIAVDLVAAWLFASLAATGVTRKAATEPIVQLRTVPELVPRPSAQHASALRGSGFGAIVVLPFLLLFLSADAAFAGFARGLPLPSGASLPARVAILGLVLAGALGLGLAARKRVSAQPWQPTRQLSYAEWAIPLALLDLLFASFVAVQFAVLFGGHDRVLETEGLTYAEYARSGFWQLLAATALTFAVVGAALAAVRADSSRERAMLRILLGVLCVLALVVLWSALRRLELYEQAFGLTRLRLAAETTALWLGGLLVLTFVAVTLRRTRRAVIRAAILGTAVGLIAFSAGNPDGRIAGRNVERWRSSGDIDLGYLSRLSADAVPALLELPRPERQRALVRIRERLRDSDPWTSANRSRARARDLLRS